MEKSKGAQIIVLNVYDRQKTDRKIYLYKDGTPHADVMFTKTFLLLKDDKDVKISKYITVKWVLDTHLVSCLTNELEKSQNFRNNFHNNRSNCLQHSSGIILKIKCKQNILCIEADIRWCNYMLPYLTMRLEFEDAFSWLSTLGGAYSSLGDQFHQCASVAGRISQQQFILAKKIGDPYLMSRCYVFLSLSLMQRGFLKYAQFILRKQFAFATQREEITDVRLVAMCRGAWCKLQYLYELKRQKRTFQTELKVNEI
ncbi:uncharacterized protein [Antedon mediterranea]|uniref:uncharacterized protein n=1 Tax=Antedon mediterranea TaxID=105859 RepID=UPI003AF83A73